MKPRYLLPIGAFALLLGVPAASAQAQDAAPARIDELARDVSRVESLRSAQDVQRRYAQYAQFGLWDEMAALFSSDARVIWGDRTVTGGREIAAWLKERMGGKRGLARGALHTELIDQPLTNLSPDGRSAKSRWEFLAMTGDGKGRTGFEGGILENEYVLEDGHWKISLLHFHPLYDGDYENGWANHGGGNLPYVPYHFTIDETGVPLPAPAGTAPRADVTLAALEARIGALNAEDAVRNLQNAYGYYVDTKMWDDVVDLFDKDGVIEIAGEGIFRGKDGVRKAMERMGPPGLSQGQLNDHPIFDMVVNVLPGNREAYARGTTLAMLGDTGKGTAGWEFVVFRNRFVKEQGLWKIREMRLYPLMKADYAVGWGDGGTYHIPPGILPAFVADHPVTGKPVTIDGFSLAGAEPLTGALPAEEAAAPKTDETTRLVEARRRLSRSSAYDGVVNISAAYSYYLDDNQWQEMSSLFARNGNKHSPFAGFYLGRDRIKAAATAMYGKPPATRASIAMHWRIQPVIHVSHDGRSANLRTRLFHPNTAQRGKASTGAVRFQTSTISTGMYANDQAVLEDGIWRLWSLTIDEPYMTMESWKEGWSGVKPVSSAQAAGQSPLVKRLAPDILMAALGRRAEHFRGGTGETVQWPGILPMWFHYKNPVSGRVPEHYWPDSVPSLVLPQSRLIANGYEMPPNGPEIDGITIELTPPDAGDMDDDD